MKMTAIAVKHSFKKVGGKLCLDFINTVGGWKFDFAANAERKYDAAVIRDKLESYADLIEWANFIGLIDEPMRKRLSHVSTAEPKGAGLVFRRALILRAALYRIICALIDDRKPAEADLDRLNAELALARKHEILAANGARIEWHWQPADSDLGQLLWPIAGSAGDLLTAADTSRIRRCLGAECGWLFLDTSRNRSRHWCTMKDCGNLAKVRRFRQQRQKAN
jgi:predicted RNA-binding Zn ribbon-like protein